MATNLIWASDEKWGRIEAEKCSRHRCMQTAY